MRKTFDPHGKFIDAPLGLAFSVSELAAIGGGDAQRAHDEIFRFALRLKDELSPSQKSLADPKDVRLAQGEDREGLSGLMTSLHGENGMFSLSLKNRDAMLDRYYNREGAIIGVIGDVGAPVGAIYLAISQPRYSTDWLLAEEFNYVLPEHRKNNYAQQLIAYAKKMSDGMKLPLAIGILSNHRTEAKVRLYERSLERVGAYFLYGSQYLSKGGAN